MSPNTRKPSLRSLQLLGEEAALARRLFLGAAFFDLYGLGGPGHAGRSLRAPSHMTERTVRSTTVGEARPAVRAPRGLDGDWSPGPRYRGAGSLPSVAVTEAGRRHVAGKRRDDPPGLWSVGRTGRDGLEPPRWRCPRIAPHREVGVCGRSGRSSFWVGWRPRSARAFAVCGPGNICSLEMVEEGVGGCQGWGQMG